MIMLGFIIQNVMQTHLILAITLVAVQEMPPSHLCHALMVLNALRHIILFQEQTTHL